MTSSGITAREPQQNPVLVFSITLTQKRVRPPVWIILVLHAELSSVRALLCRKFVKGLYHSNLPSTLELVCDVPSLLHANTQSPRDPRKKSKGKWLSTKNRSPRRSTPRHPIAMASTAKPPDPMPCRMPCALAAVLLPESRAHGCHMQKTLFPGPAW